MISNPVVAYSSDRAVKGPKSTTQLLLPEDSSWTQNNCSYSLPMVKLNAVKTLSTTEYGQGSTLCEPILCCLAHSLLTSLISELASLRDNHLGLSCPCCARAPTWGNGRSPYTRGYWYCYRKIIIPWRKKDLLYRLYLSLFLVRTPGTCCGATKRARKLWPAGGVNHDWD